MKINKLSVGYKETLYRPILDFIQDKLLESNRKYDMAFEIFEDGDVLSLILTVRAFKFSFAFFLNEKRFSFFIDQKEIMDEYLTNEKESLDSVHSLTTLFSNPMEVQSFKGRNQKIYKIIYRYFVNSENGAVVFKDPQHFAFNFWRDKTVEEKVLDPCLNYINN